MTSLYQHYGGSGVWFQFRKEALSNEVTLFHCTMKVKQVHRRLESYEGPELQERTLKAKNPLS